MSELADARDAALREAEKMKEEAEAIAAAYEVVTAESEARAGEVESAELRLQAAEARFKHEADAADRRIEEALAECERRRKDAEVTLYTLYLIPQILSFQRRAASWMSVRRAKMSFNYVRLNSKHLTNRFSWMSLRRVGGSWLMYATCTRGRLRPLGGKSRQTGWLPLDQQFIPPKT
jgi:hypothetical protein